MRSSVEDSDAPLLPSCLKAHDQHYRKYFFMPLDTDEIRYFPSMSLAVHDRYNNSCPFVLFLTKQAIIGGRFSWIQPHDSHNDSPTPHPPLPMSLAHRQDLNDKTIKQSMKNTLKHFKNVNAAEIKCQHYFFPLLRKLEKV